jgi:hypothetical protein
MSDYSEDLLEPLTAYKRILRFATAWATANRCLRGWAYLS